MAQTEAPAVLVVDDDPHILAFLSAGLSKLGYQPWTASDIQEGTKLLRTNPFSLILCDYEMPGGTGMELLQYVASVYPHVPFIMLTGRAEKELAKEAITRGALDFIGKPIELHVLERVLTQNWERLEQNRRAYVHTTHGVLKGTMRALVRAIDAKDPYTAMHSERVTRIALRLGKAVGLDEDTLRILEYAAFLHDVGKIGVPDHVLRKAGPLDDDEWLLIREHPARSAEIILEVSELVEVATIARHHHERRDGAGYPDGLQGDAIPYLSQVLTLADVYEALTSARAYRPALPDKEAREVLRRGWGHHFNPHLGAVFEQLEELPEPSNSPELGWLSGGGTRCDEFGQ